MVFPSAARTFFQLVAVCLGLACGQAIAIAQEGNGTGIESGVLPPIEGVDSGELPPAAGASAAATGFSGSLWSSLALNEASQLVGSLAVPSRSPVLAGLWRRMLVSDGMPADAKTPAQFNALRSEWLYRAGLIEESAQASVTGGGKRLAGQNLAAARIALALGRSDDACGTLKTVDLATATLTKPQKTEAILMTAYCVSKDKQARNAGLAAEVMRDQGVKSPLALAVLDAIAKGKPAKLPKVDKLSLIDYRFLTLLGPVPVESVAGAAGLDVLVAIAVDREGAPETRIAAAEMAAALHGLTAQQLIAAYADAEIPEDIRANPLAGGAAGALARAALFQAATSEQAPKRRLQYVAALIDEARRDGLLVTLAPVVAELIGGVPPDNDVLWFAEPAIEVLVAAGYYDRAMPWAIASGGSLLHWTLLVDIADPTAAVPVESALGYAEQMVQASELPPAVVQRLATVLDALDYNVPIGIWDGAQRAPQDTSGHLPATGQLSALQAAAKSKDVGRTVLLTLAAFGPDIPENGNLLTLGDTMRALRAAGLDSDARRLGVEALFNAWPRKRGS